MAYATPDELALYLQRELTDQQQATAALLLDLASAEILTRIPALAALDPPPGDVRAVTLAVAARAMANPDKLVSEQIDTYAVNYGTRRDGGSGVHLTAADLAQLKRLTGPHVGTIPCTPPSAGRTGEPGAAAHPDRDRPTVPGHRRPVWQRGPRPRQPPPGSGTGRIPPAAACG